MQNYNNYNPINNQRNQANANQKSQPHINQLNNQINNQGNRPNNNQGNKPINNKGNKPINNKGNKPINNKGNKPVNTQQNDPIIDDDSFVITGSEKKSGDDAAFFKFIIPTLIVGALVAIALVTSLLIVPTKNDKDSKKTAKKESSINQSSDVLYDTINDVSLDGASDLEDMENTEDTQDTAENEDTETNNSTTDNNIVKAVVPSEVKNANESSTNNDYYTDNYTPNNNTYYGNSFDVPNRPTQQHPTSSRIDITNDIKTSSTNIPLFLQADPRWGSTSYAGSTIAQLGSGATCMSMVYVYLKKDSSYNPLKMANESINKRQVINGVGTSPDFMTKGAKELGLRVYNVNRKTNTIIQNIMQGRPVIAYMKPGSMASNSTYIVIRNYNLSQFMIHDPNSQYNSNKNWAFDDITKNIDCAWAYSR